MVVATRCASRLVAARFNSWFSACRVSILWRRAVFSASYLSIIVVRMVLIEDSPTDISLLSDDTAACTAVSTASDRAFSVTLARIESSIASVRS